MAEEWPGTPAEQQWPGQAVEAPSLGRRALDYVKQAGAGIAEGFADPMIAKLGEAQLQAENLTNLPAPKVSDYSEAAAKALPEATTPGERIVRGTARAIPGSLAFGPPSPAGLGLAGLTGGLSAAAEEAGAPAPVVAGVGLLGGIGGIKAANFLRSLRDWRSAPVSAELAKHVDDLYGQARGLGTQLNANAISKAVGGLKEQVPSESAVYRALEKFENKHALTPAKIEPTEAGIPPYFTPAREKPPIDFDELERLRRIEVGGLAGREGEAHNVSVVKRGIDDFLAGLDKQPGAVMQGNAAELADIAKRARRAAQANYRMNAIDTLKERAEAAIAQGKAPERAYRHELKSFITPSRQTKISLAEKEGFTSQEIAELKKAAGLGSFTTMLKILGIAGGHAATLGVGTAAYLYDPHLWPLMALGYGSRYGAGAIARQNFNRMARMTAARSPLAEAQGFRTPGFYSNLTIPAMQGLAPIVQNAVGFKGGGRVTRTFRVKA